MYICGKNVVKEKLNTNEQIHKAIISNGFKDQKIIEELRNRKIKIQFRDKQYLDKLTPLNHQGIILEVEEVKTYSLDEILEELKGKENPLLVMLDHLEDPHNFGAIIRTCESLGIDAIIIPNDRSVTINSTVVKTSAGAIAYTKIVRVANLYSTITKLKKNNFWIIGTDMQGEDYTKLDYKMPICLVIGSEGHGMSKIIKDNCDFIASINMKGKINSLNASVSCGIILSRIISGRE